MGTELGSATVKVTLNVEDAKKQIEALRKEIRESSGGSPGAAAPGTPPKPPKSNPRPAHPATSGDLPQDPDLGNGGGGTLTLTNQGDRGDVARDMFREIMRFVRIDRMRKFGGLHVEAAMQEASLAGRAGSAASKLVGEGLPGAAGLAGTLYASASAVGKSLPYAMEALKQGGVPIPKDVSDVLNDFKNIINNLEDRVSNLIKAPKEALDLWAGGARITGRLPDFTYYWNQAYDTGVAEDDLERKFDSFKRMEVAGAVGRSAAELFMKSFDR